MSDPRVEGLGVHDNDDDDDVGSEKKKKMQKKKRKKGNGIRNLNFPKGRNSSKSSSDSPDSSSSKSGGRGSSDGGGGGCFSCLKPRKNSGESNIERQTSDPNSSEFTKEMLRDFIEKNDFYSKECNPYALHH